MISSVGFPKKKVKLLFTHNCTPPTLSHATDTISTQLQTFLNCVKTGLYFTNKITSMGGTGEKLWVFEHGPFV